MDVCKTILEAITHALESEECRLRPRSERQGKPLWPWTVRGGYNEDWVRYLMVRELSGWLLELELEIEAKSGNTSNLDLLICGLASVELKGPFRVRQNEKFYKPNYRKILRDFEKQRDRATQEPTLQHFVLTIIYSPKSDFDSGYVEKWLAQLESDVRGKIPGICIKLQESEPLVLNDNDWLMKCCLYCVR